MSTFDISKYNQSSFRGVPFYTEKTSLTGGKRLTTHTFINAGTEVEENGVKNKVFKVKAYIGGEDYINQRDALIDAFELTGGGTLIDQFYGTLEVQVGTYVITEEKGSLGKAVLEITFEKVVNQAVAEDILVYTVDNTDEVLAVFASDYDSTVGENILADVAQQITAVLERVNDAVKFLEDKRDFAIKVRNVIGATISKVKSSVLSVQSLSEEIIDIVSAFDEVLNFDSFGAEDQKSFTNGLRSNVEAAAVTQFDNSIDKVVANNVRAYTYALNSLLTQTAIKNLEIVDFATGDDFGSVKDDVLTIIDILEKDIETNIDDDINKIVARSELLDSYKLSKRSFIEFYTQKYSGVQNLEDNTLVATTDVLSLTLDRYADIARVDEVIENNDIIDPLFINGDVKLLGR